MAVIEGTVRIPADEYLTLLRRSMDLSDLEAAGVDKWDGYDEFTGRSAADDALLRAMVREKLSE